MRDPPLTSHGIDQTKEMAAYFASHPVDRIYSSPYWRCLQTSSPTAEALGQRILIEHGLSEWYGPAGRGLHPRPPQAERLAVDFPLVDPATKPSSLLYPDQKGETVPQLHDRAKRALDLLIASIDSEPESTRPKTILLVSHAATLIALGRALIGDESAEIGAATASISEYRRNGTDRIGNWTCVRNADCSHLSSGSERDWSFAQYDDVLEEGCLPDPNDEPLTDGGRRARL